MRSKTANLNQSAYNLVAANYAQEHGEALTWQPELDAFIRYLRSPKLIIDLGCGHGDETIYLAEQVSDTEVIGLDFAANMIKLAESKRSRVKFLVDDIVTYQPPAPVDGLWARATLHHLTEAELAQTLANIVRHAAPGLIVGMVNKHGITAETEQKPKYGQTLRRYFNYLDEAKVAQLATRYGFKILDQYTKSEGEHTFLISYLQLTP